MKEERKKVLRDMVFVGISIVGAFLLSRSGLLGSFLNSLDAFAYVGVFIAGMFFTSVFTTAPSIIVLADLSHSVPLPALVLIGGFGAMFGDYILFTFTKDRIGEDMHFIFHSIKHKRWMLIFKTRIFRFLIPFVGALIIASPLPDEIGITFLGIKDQY